MKTRATRYRPILSPEFKQLEITGLPKPNASGSKINAFRAGIEAFSDSVNAFRTSRLFETTPPG